MNEKKRDGAFDLAFLMYKMHRKRIETFDCNFGFGSVGVCLVHALPCASHILQSNSWLIS
jgi:hypothetical protein